MNLHKKQENFKYFRQLSKKYDVFIFLDIDNHNTTEINKLRLKLQIENEVKLFMIKKNILKKKLNINFEKGKVIILMLKSKDINKKKYKYKKILLNTFNEYKIKYIIIKSKVDDYLEHDKVFYFNKNVDIKIISKLILEDCKFIFFNILFKMPLYFIKILNYDKNKKY